MVRTDCEAETRDLEGLEEREESRIDQEGMVEGVVERKFKIVIIV